MIERFVKDRFDIRAKKPVMKNVVHVVRDFDDPIPPDVAGLDLITFFFAYHDITYMPVDRAVMNRKMFDSAEARRLPDHSGSFGKARRRHHGRENAAPDRGGVLRQEIEAAGFKLVAEADFLRNPEDPRDTKVFQPKIPVDEFVLKYQKPE